MSHKLEVGERRSLVSHYTFTKERGKRGGGRKREGGEEEKGEKGRRAAHPEVFEKGFQKTAPILYTQYPGAVWERIWSSFAYSSRISPLVKVRVSISPQV